jgi:hypothetical protein
LVKHKCSSQKSDAAEDGAQTDKGFDDDECDPYDFVFHDYSPLLW